MNSTYDTDVLIVGAGPTGLTLAATLAAAGIDDSHRRRLPAGANTSRAAAVNARTLEVLEGSRRDEATGQGGHPRRDSPSETASHLMDHRLQRADDRLPVHASDPSERHRETAQRAAARARRDRTSGRRS